MRDKTYTIGDLLPLMRGKHFCLEDEGQSIILALECEDWTHVVVNVNNGILDAMTDLVVDDMDTDCDKIRLWIKTSEEFCVPVMPLPEPPKEG